MAFNLKNSCQNRLQIQNVQRVSGTRAFRASPMRSMHMQKRIASSIVAFMETAAPASVQMTVSLKLSLRYGEHIKLVGADQQFGAWQLDSAPEMTWNEGDIWTVTLDLPTGFTSEYKFVHYIPGQEPIWEHTENRFLTIPQNLPSGPVALETAWCEPATTFGEEQNIFTTAAAAASEAQIDEAEFSSQEGLVTPAFQSAVDSVASFFNGAATEQEKMAEQGSEDVAALEAAFEADDALKVEQEEEIKTIEEENTLEEMETEDAIAAELAQPSTEGKTMLESAAKTAGALALGVAGAALLSALAIDVADTAIIGAVAAAAGGAVLSGTGVAPKASRKTITNEDGEEVETEEVEVVSEERNIKGAGEAGVVIAAGLASAFDIGRAMVDSMTAGGVIDEEKESTEMDQE